MGEAEAGGGTSGWTRRRTIRIMAAGLGLPVLIAAVRATVPKARMFAWHGQVLDDLAELTLWHTDAALCRRTFARIEAEIARYDRIFSLYRTDSETARLNAEGELRNPCPELRAVIEESQRIGALSGGAFDISVQPLWRLYEAHFWSHAEIVPDIVARAQEIARALVDFRRIETSRRRIVFDRPGMGITLNSIAQGFITDAIADLLRNEGFETAVVDLGEYRTLGAHPDGHPWRIGVRNALAADEVDRVIELDDMALAVSGGYGTTFEATGQFHHIFDPQTGASAHRLADAAVVSSRATTAAALAVAICVMGEERARIVLDRCPGTHAIVTRPDGATVAIGRA